MWQKLLWIAVLFFIGITQKAHAKTPNELIMQIRISALSIPSSGPCVLGIIPNLTKDEHQFAINIYWEGWYEDSASHYMIGQVVLARKRDILFPHTVKEVIWQKNAFSWTIQRSIRNIPSKRFHKRMWHRAQLSARAVLRAGLVLKRKWSCVRFYKRTDNKAVSRRSKAWFEKYLTPVGVVGAHTFYCYKPEVRLRELAKLMSRERMGVNTQKVRRVAKVHTHKRKAKRFKRIRKVQRKRRIASRKIVRKRSARRSVKRMRSVGRRVYKRKKVKTRRVYKRKKIRKRRHTHKRKRR